MKIAYLANYKEISGYSIAARGYIKALETQDVDLACRNIQIIGNANEEVCFEGEKKDLMGVDVTILNTLPDFYQKASSGKTIGLFCWETTHIPERWVKKINKELDAVVVFNMSEKFVCEKCGVEVPVYVVAPHVDIEKREFKRGTINSELMTKDTYVFYNISDFNARKNLEDLIMCYFSEFRSSDDCILFLHVPCGENEGRRQKICDLIEYTKQSLKIGDYAKVFLSYAFASDSEIFDIHCSGDTFVTLSRGESWNIPLFNACAIGNRIISTPCAGPTDFCPMDIKFVDSHLSPVHDMFEYDQEIYTGKGMWLSSNMSEAMKKMRTQFNMGRIEEKKYNTELLNKYSAESVGEKLLEVAKKVL